ncbi:hypothetical protein SAMN05444158_2978 [Bradyrhizobium canariense]|uniref:Uncharacterized protein n=1 Tax=Bradyrhizobium canariense TaxID=255045 RepID=A0A1H1UIK0_9BRAD|nr:hypothetical protein SAMN05444158_2978 [Bradyrhizobium canariense]
MSPSSTLMTEVVIGFAERCYEVRTAASHFSLEDFFCFCIRFVADSCHHLADYSHPSAKWRSP